MLEMERDRERRGGILALVCVDFVASVLIILRIQRRYGSWENRSNDRHHGHEYVPRRRRHGHLPHNFDCCACRSSPTGMFRCTLSVSPIIVPGPSGRTRSWRRRVKYYQSMSTMVKTS